jgi:hypothetical protein
MAYAAGRKRQSSRTGFVHGADTNSDTISIYDNFCFVYALLTQRKAAEILEAKALLLRLLDFQTADGAFPICLHDYPHSYDPYLGLKIAPILLRSLQGHIGCKDRIDAALQKILSFYQNKTLPPLWEFRYQICLGHKPPLIDVPPEQIWEYWISLQFLQTPTCDFYYPKLGLAPHLSTPQVQYEPAPHLIEWACAAAIDSFTPRLLAPHPAQLHLAALDKVELTHQPQDSLYKKEPFKLYWSDQSLHSLVLIADQIAIADAYIDITLPATFEFGRDDLFEVQFFCDASPDLSIEIDGAKGTAFALNQPIQIKTPSLTCTLQFELLQGEGDFCGRIFRSNRPGQIAAHQYEAYDWKIGLRTLRRSSDCIIRVSWYISERFENSFSIAGNEKINC